MSSPHCLNNYVEVHLDNKQSSAIIFFKEKYPCICYHPSPRHPEEQVKDNSFYKISREKFEPEPGFEPRTSGFLAQRSTTLSYSGSHASSCSQGTNYKFFFQLIIWFDNSFVKNYHLFNAGHLIFIISHLINYNYCYKITSHDFLNSIKSNLYQK